jgi:myo-inositol-1(or 4)-monophosphatase
VNEICPQTHAGSICPTLELAVMAAQAAGTVIQAGANDLAVIERKGVGDLVSEVDREADRVACQVLSETSDLPILSEELNAQQNISDDMWIVDPLDASSAFLMSAGPSYPAVLIALRQGGQTTVGVTYFPLTGEWFYAKRGRGAWQDGKRLVCDSNESLSDVWVEMNQYGDAEYETPFFTRLRSQLRSRSGCQLVTSNVPYSGVAMRIAAGESSLAVAVHDNNPSNTKQASWDIAAPQIIMEEAGGVFLTPEGGPVDPFASRPIIVSRSKQLAMEVVALNSKQTI